MSEMVERVGAELRRVCLAEFGATWNNDVAWRFARSAIAAMKELPDDVVRAAIEADDKRTGNQTIRHIHRAIIDAMLAEPGKP